MLLKISFVIQFCQHSHKIPCNCVVNYYTQQSHIVFKLCLFPSSAFHGAPHPSSTWCWRLLLEPTSCAVCSIWLTVKVTLIIYTFNIFWFSKISWLIFLTKAMIVFPRTILVSACLKSYVYRPCWCGIFVHLKASRPKHCVQNNQGCFGVLQSDLHHWVFT